MACRLILLAGLTHTFFSNTDRAGDSLSDDGDSVPENGNQNVWKRAATLLTPSNDFEVALQSILCNVAPANATQHLGCRCYTFDFQQILQPSYHLLCNAGMHAVCQKTRLCAQEF